MTSKDTQLSYEQLEECYQVMAQIVCEHGDIYLPIFHRLHHEMEKRRSQVDLKNIAYNLAKKHDINTHKTA